MTPSLPLFEFDDKILMQGAEISRKLDQLRQEKFPPDAQKTLRRFAMGEVAHYLGVSPNNLKRLHLEGKGPSPLITNGGRRVYTAEQLIELRYYLDKNGRSDASKYVPRRKGVIAHPRGWLVQAGRGIGFPWRVRRMASMARIERRRAVSTTERMSA